MEALSLLSYREALGKGMTWPHGCLEKVAQAGGQRIDSGGRVGVGPEFGSKGPAPAQWQQWGWGQAGHSAAFVGNTGDGQGVWV